MLTRFVIVAVAQGADDEGRLALPQILRKVVMTCTMRRDVGVQEVILASPVQERHAQSRVREVELPCTGIEGVVAGTGGLPSGVTCVMLTSSGRKTMPDMSAASAIRSCHV